MNYVHLRTSCFVIAALALLVGAKSLDQEEGYISQRKLRRNLGAFGGFSDPKSVEIKPVDDAALVPIPPDYKEKLYFHIVTGSKLIDSPLDCHGCHVLWTLHNALRDDGYRTNAASVCPPEYVPKEKLVVIIYPEVFEFTCDTPGAIHVRWILAPLGVNAPVSNALKWGDDDLVFNYASYYDGMDVHHTNVLQVICNPEEGDVTDISDEVFFSKNRLGIAWMMQKGHHEDMTSTLEEIGYDLREIKGTEPHDIMQKIECFVTHEPYTYWTWIAAMSGAISVVRPVPGVTKYQWAMGTFMGAYLQHYGYSDIPGVAYGWGDNEIQYAQTTMKDLRSKLLKVKQWGAEVTVPRFARDCYRYGQGERVNFEGAKLVKDFYRPAQSL